MTEVVLAQGSGEPQEPRLTSLRAVMPAQTVADHFDHMDTLMRGMRRCLDGAETSLSQARQIMQETERTIAAWRAEHENDDEEGNNLP